MTHAKDLTKEPPRSPRVRVGGYALMGRMIDKGRAYLNGTAGEYSFACPVDQMLFHFKGVTKEAVRPVLESAATEDQIAVWFDTHGTPKTPAEVKAWGDATEADLPYSHSDKREWFSKACAELGLNPKTTTLFDYLEADDRATFKR